MAPKKYPALAGLISLEQKRAVVTGGARGIGLAIAYRLAEAGATVGIVDMDEKQGKQATAELGGYGFEAFFFHSDVSQQEAVQRTMDEAISRMGGLDILVNNAGIFPATPLEQMTEADIEKILAVNLKGLNP